MSLSETLMKALMDTMMGMGTVFAILIVISIVISLFKFLREDKKSPAGPPETETADAPEEDDDEITAVIMAALRMHLEREQAECLAIAAETGEPEYIVRSIKRRK